MVTYSLVLSMNICGVELKKSLIENNLQDCHGKELDEKILQTLQ